VEFRLCGYAVATGRMKSGKVCASGADANSHTLMFRCESSWSTVTPAVVLIPHYAEKQRTVTEGDNEGKRDDDGSRSDDEIRGFCHAAGRRFDGLLTLPEP